MLSQKNFASSVRRGISFQPFERSAASDLACDAIGSIDATTSIIEQPVDDVIEHLCYIVTVGCT